MKRLKYYHVALDIPPNATVDNPAIATTEIVVGAALRMKLTYNGDAINGVNRITMYNDEEALCSDSFTPIRGRSYFDCIIPGKEYVKIKYTKLTLRGWAEEATFAHNVALETILFPYTNFTDDDREVWRRSGMHGT